MTPYCSEIWLRMFFHNPFNNRLSDDETLVVLEHLEQLWLHHDTENQFTEAEMAEQYDRGERDGYSNGMSSQSNVRYRDGYLDGIKDTQDLIKTFMQESRNAMAQSV